MLIFDPNCFSECINAIATISPPQLIPCQFLFATFSVLVNSTPACWQWVNVIKLDGGYFTAAKTIYTFTDLTINRSQSNYSHRLARSESHSRL